MSAAQTTLALSMSARLYTQSNPDFDRGANRTKTSCPFGNACNCPNIRARLFRPPWRCTTSAACNGRWQDHGPQRHRLVRLAAGSREGALPNLRVPRRIAAGSLYRDLHAFYAAKDNLFPERTSGLIFFENMMGIFFTGRDLTEEVLSETRPEIRFVVARQQYDPAIGTPQVQLPAMAVVFRLRHPEQAAEMTEEAWQKAVGLVNFTRGQKADPGLILDRQSYAGIRFTVGRFSTADAKGKTELPTRFNTQPSIARLGDYLVLSSTEQIDPRRARCAARARWPLRATGGRRFQRDRTQWRAVVVDFGSERKGHGPPEHGRKGRHAGFLFRFLLTFLEARLFPWRRTSRPLSEPSVAVAHAK